MVTIIWLVVGFIIIIALGISVKAWISIYNKFQYWITRAQRKFADVDVVLAISEHAEDELGEFSCCSEDGGFAIFSASDAAIVGP